jgi:hypothetical protein
MSESSPKDSTTAHDGTVPPRRKDLRVPGPFEGRWVGALTVPVHIHDLSMGGCLIQAYHEQVPGRRFTLEIELPYHGWLRVQAESLYVREGYGFAARFIDLPDQATEILENVIWRLMSKNPSDL